MKINHQTTISGGTWRAEFSLAGRNLYALLPGRTPDAGLKTGTDQQTIRERKVYRRKPVFTRRLTGFPSATTYPT